MSNRLEETVNHLVTIVQTIDSRLLELEAKVDSRFVDLEAKVDSRLHDTRPNLEAIQSQLTQVIDSQQRVREEMSGELRGVRSDLSSLREEMSGEIQGVRNDLSSLRAETEKGFRTIDRRMERQIGEFERLHAYQRDLEDRVDKIEKQLSS
jgi:hypothetical protein